MKAYILFFILFLLGCTEKNSILVEVTKRYPGCDILQIEKMNSNLYEIFIQCGNAPPKKIRMHSK